MPGIYYRILQPKQLGLPAFGVDLLNTPTDQIPEELADRAKAIKDHLIELAAETNDALMEKYFEGVELTADEFSAIMRECLKNIYDPKALKNKARQTLKVTGRWDATEFAYQSNKNK